MESATLQPASDHSLLVTFGNREDVQLHERVRALLLSLLKQPLPGTVNLHPAYATLLIGFDPLTISPDQLEAAVRTRLSSHPTGDEERGRVIEMPVSYGGEFGPDLDGVARHCGLTPDEVVERHCAADYLVCFLGFAPGYAYLGGMDPMLATPRLATPRKLVGAGSIGIGGGQTGVYSLPSPGGWRIIGRTPRRLFDVRKREPALLAMGDRVRFRPISADQFATWDDR